MCVILDADRVGLVFGRNRSPAGRDLLDWLERPRAARPRPQLVVGGRLLRELTRNPIFAKWAETATQDGRVRHFPDVDIAKEESALPSNRCRSNDRHIIALARTSRARILYSNDGALQDDFRDLKLVPRPQGRLLPTGESQNASRRRRGLLRRPNLCPNQ